jgi:hypothetical protein
VLQKNNKVYNNKRTFSRKKQKIFRKILEIYCIPICSSTKTNSYILLLAFYGKKNTNNKKPLSNK